MKLQLALDVLTTQTALVILSKVARYIHIIEIGTPLIKHEGISVIKTLRQRYPLHELMVDLKTMDCGEYEADFAFENGADLVTVLGCSNDDTIKGTIKSARKYGKKSQVDMIGVANKKTAANKIYNFGIDYVGIHTGIDMQLQGMSPMQDLIDISKIVPPTSISVAGGIKLSTLPEVIRLNPGIVVVGGAITSSENPEQIAQTMSKLIMNNNA